LNLVDVSQVKITVGVPEMDVKYLKPGLPVPLRVDALGEQVFWGTLDSLAFKADAATKTFRAVVRVPNPDELIRPGMVSRVALLRRDIPEALVSPLHALVDKGGERLVFVEKEGVARARMVQLGVLDGDRIQVTAGLEPGDRLIVSGQKDVEDGTKVVVQ
jgi:membrane fusion protein (multidrug efflux system)